MIANLRHSPLFYQMSPEDIQGCIACSQSQLVTYQKDQLIFSQRDIPQKLLVLVRGMVVVGNDTPSGRRSIVATLDQPGEVFGEVFLFLNKGSYDHYAQALAPSTVLQMPKEYLHQPCEEHCRYHARLVANLLNILSQKAYYLNQKLQILSCATLRQKIARVLLQQSDPDGRVVLAMNREELADFLGTTRPSLSRELMRMQEEGLLRVQRREVQILDLAALQTAQI